MLQCSKPFLFILGNFFSNKELMPCSSIVNKATGQVCSPAEKKPDGEKTKQHKSKWNRLEWKTFAAIWGLTAIDTILVAG